MIVAGETREEMSCMRALRWAAVLLVVFATALPAQGSTLVYVVRHAEKAAEPASDPPLTAVGQARAVALSEVLSNAGVTSIISTPLQRTMRTAAPLAAKLGLTPELVATGGDVAVHAGEVANAVRRHAGEAVLVVGHSNTVMAIAAALGAPRLPDLCDSDYDQLLVIELVPSGPPRMVRSRYGAPAADPSCAQIK